MYLLIFQILFSLANATIVDLGYSKYQGQIFPNGIAQWLGIRYAAPPVGDLRFAEPQDPLATDGIQDASEHASICIPTSQSIPNGTSEDCLFLDVFAPANKTNLPVYFWIQGGGFNKNSNPNNNGTGLIQASNNSIVVVTFNYRVGPYGFLAGSEMESVNNGLKDQIKALEWVQRHIAKFGGNPNHVVIGGASAGAASITLLLSAYNGTQTGLFHAAAAESQSFASMLTLSESQSVYNNLVIRTGCASQTDTLACLRNLDVQDLQDQNINTPVPPAQEPPLYMYAPVVDGTLVPDYTYRLFHEGKFLHVPVIFGDDTNEGTAFVPKNTSTLGEADTFIQNNFPKLTLSQLQTINEIYLQDPPNTTYPNASTYWQPTSTAYGEIRYICPGIDMSSIFSKAGLSSWNYHYAVQDPEKQASGLGVDHTVEVNAIWGPEYVSGSPPSSYYSNGSNADIVPVMQGYWTSFVRAFDPNVHRYPGSPEWEVWGEEGGKRLFVRTNETRMEGIGGEQKGRCEYLVGIGVELGQ